MGGFSSVYMATFCGVMGSTFGLRSTTALVNPVISPAGMASMARNTLTAGGPAILGLAIGIASFGDGKELWNLMRNAPTYSREIRAVQKEHYY